MESIFRIQGRLATRRSWIPSLPRHFAKAAYRAGTTSVGQAVTAISAANPQAVVLVATGGSAAAFIEHYRSAGGGAQLISHSGVDVEQLTKRLSDEQMQGVIIAQVAPNPYKISSRLTKEFQDLIARSKPDAAIGYAMMEGFIAAKVIVEAARRMGPHVNREAFVQALDSMDAVDLGGYLVSFKPNSRVGSRFVEMTIVTTGRIRQ